MHKPDDKVDLPGEHLVKDLQEELRPIEPAPHVKEEMLERILNRTVRTVRIWREWLNRPNDKLDD